MDHRDLDVQALGAGMPATRAHPSCRRPLVVAKELPVRWQHAHIGKHLTSAVTLRVLVWGTKSRMKNKEEEEEEEKEEESLLQLLRQELLWGL